MCNVRNIQKPPLLLKIYYSNELKKSSDSKKVELGWIHLRAGFVQSGKIREKMVISENVRESQGKSWKFIYCLEKSRFTGISQGKFR